MGAEKKEKFELKKPLRSDKNLLSSCDVRNMELLGNPSLVVNDVTQI